MVSKKQMDKWAKEQRDMEARAMAEVRAEGEVSDEAASKADSYLSKLEERQQEDLQDRTLRALDRATAIERAMKAKLEEEAAKKQRKQ